MTHADRFDPNIWLAASPIYVHPIQSGRVWVSPKPNPTLPMDSPNEHSLEKIHIFLQGSLNPTLKEPKEFFNKDHLAKTWAATFFFFGHPLETAIGKNSHLFCFMFSRYSSVTHFA